MASVVHEDQLTRIRRRLVAQARLFENPQAYVAGIEDTLAALRIELGLTGELESIVLPDRPPARMI